MSNLAVPKGKKVKKPLREPDMFSKRGIPYWFHPEWVRNLNGHIGRVIAIKDRRGGVNLHMLAKNGNVNYIEGSIQREFHDWHTDRQIDAILLGIDEDQLIEVAWQYE